MQVMTLVRSEGDLIRSKGGAAVAVDGVLALHNRGRQVDAGHQSSRCRSSVQQVQVMFPERSPEGAAVATD